MRKVSEIRNSGVKRKVALRSCSACGMRQEKKSLIRVAVLDGGQTLELDKTGRAGGRGLYVCNEDECIIKLTKLMEKNRVRVLSGMGRERRTVLMNCLREEISRPRIG